MTYLFHGHWTGKRPDLRYETDDPRRLTVTLIFYGMLINDSPALALMKWKVISLRRREKNEGLDIIWFRFSRLDFGLGFDYPRRRIRQ